MNTKSKGLLVLLLLCSILFLVSSCKKNETTATAAPQETKVETPVTETKTAAAETKKEEPAQTKTEEKVSEVKTEETAPVAAPASETKTEAPVETKTEEPVAVTVVAEAEVPAVTGTPEEEKTHVYSDTLTYDGFTTTVTVDSTSASVTLPEGIGAEEIAAVASVINAAFPEEASLVTYALDGDTLVLTYPEQSSQFLLSAVEALRKEAMALLDSYTTEVVEEEAVAVKDVTMETAVTETEEIHVYADTLTYGSLSTTLIVDSTRATVTLPEGITADDVAAVAALIGSEYPAEASLVTYSIEGDKLVLTYPEQSDDFLLAVVDTLRTEAIALLDEAAPESEESSSVEFAIEAVSTGEEGFSFAVAFSYNGYSASITVTSTEATLTIPEGVSEEDIAAVAAIVAESYPAEASLLTYSIEGDTLTVYYPEQTAEYLASALTYLEKDAEALLDMYPLTVEEAPLETAVASVKAETPLETAPAAVETKTGETVPAVVTETIPVAVAEAKPAEAAPAPVVAPAVDDKAEKVKRFSVAVSGTAKYVPEFKAQKGWNPLDVDAALRAECKLGSFGIGLKGQFDFSQFIEAGAYVRFTVASVKNFDFYVLAGGGGMFSLKSENNIPNGFYAEAGIGVDWNINDNFSIFAEGVGEWSSSLKWEVGGTLGLKVSF